MPGEDWGGEHPYEKVVSGMLFVSLRRGSKTDTDFSLIHGTQDETPLVLAISRRYPSLRMHSQNDRSSCKSCIF